jgi:Pectate lyase superfamily protein
MMKKIFSYGLFIINTAALFLALPSFAQTRDTTICQTWKIQTGINQFALKDTCWKLTISGNANNVSDTIYITNNVMYQGRQGVPGPTGPQGLPGICAPCDTLSLSKGIWFNVTNYGAIPNDGQSDQAAFDRAIAAAKASGFLNLYVPAGTYHINQLELRTHFGSWRMRGDGANDLGDGKGTRIVSNHTAGAAINVIAVRMAHLSDFELVGANNFPALLTNRNNPALWQHSAWASRYDISRYNAYSGIGFDLGQPQAPWSAQVIVERVKITGYNVGINISGGEGNMQGDTYMIRDCKLWYNVYGASIGQDQCRAVTFDNVTIEGNYCAYTNTQFGRGNGSGFAVLNSQITTCYKVLETTTAYRGALLLQNVFTEACGIIGNVSGLGVNQNAASFIACEIGLDDNGYLTGNAQQWATPSVVMNAGSNVSMVGVNIHTKKDLLLFGGSHYTLTGTTFTQLRNVWWQWPHDVRIGSVPMFRESDHRMEDDVTITAGKTFYIRPHTRTITVQQPNGGYTRRLYQSPLPVWEQIAWANDNGQKVQQIPCASCKVGDYLNGTNAELGGVQVPAFRVTAMAGTTATIQRIAPDATAGIISHRYNFYVPVKE